LKIAPEWGYYGLFDAQETVRCESFFDICIPWKEGNLSIVKGFA